MTEDPGSTAHAGATVPQDVGVPEAEQEQILAVAKRNAALVSRLAPRVAFEDEPSRYADVIERARG
jgi:hypothetical protein